jgi:hypothetical protein
LGTEYSIRFVKWSYLGQRQYIQSTILTFYLYKIIYLKLTYVYFYESTLQNQSIHLLSHFQTNLKIFMSYILIFDSNIVQNDFIYQTGGSIYAAQ